MKTAAQVLALVGGIAVVEWHLLSLIADYDNYVVALRRFMVTKSSADFFRVLLAGTLFIEDAASL